MKRNHIIEVYPKCLSNLFEWKTHVEKCPLGNVNLILLQCNAQKKP